MLKIIDNKIYDTEKTTELYEYIHKYPKKTIFGTTITYTEKVKVFKTKKGNYFNYFYPDEKDNLDWSRERIESTTELEFKELLKDIDPKKYIELFGNLELEEA